MSSQTPNIGAQAFGWWRTLVPEHDDEVGSGRSINRAALAKMRRTKNALDMLFIPEFRLLCQKLGDRQENLERTFRIARLLAHVRINAYPKVARALGPQSGDEGAVMSEARFQRLLQARDDEDRDQRLIRAIHMLKNTANVADLADAIWWWNDHTRRRWAFDYFNAPPPESETPPAAA